CMCIGAHFHQQTCAVCGNICAVFLRLFVQTGTSKRYTVSEYTLVQYHFNVKMNALLLKKLTVWSFHINITGPKVGTNLHLHLVIWQTLLSKATYKGENSQATS